jgi:hypothetical protein
VALRLRLPNANPVTGAASQIVVAYAQIESTIVIKGTTTIGYWGAFLVFDVRGLITAGEGAQWMPHRLMQHGGVVYSDPARMGSGAFSAECVSLMRLAKKAMPSISHSPRWNEELAKWPFIAGKPMYFIEQFDVPPGSPLRPDARYVRDRAFLFGSGYDGRVVFVVYEYPILKLPVLHLTAHDPE